MEENLQSETSPALGNGAEMEQKWSRNGDRNNMPLPPMKTDHFIMEKQQCILNTP